MQWTFAYDGATPPLSWRLLDAGKHKNLDLKLVGCQIKAAEGGIANYRRISVQWLYLPHYTAGGRDWGLPWAGMS